MTVEARVKWPKKALGIFDFRACLGCDAQCRKGMSVSGNFTQLGAKIDFHSCEAPEGYGGGLAVRNGDLSQLSGNMQFDGCTAHAGGGVFAERKVIVSDVMAFDNCTASRAALGGSKSMYTASTAVYPKVRWGIIQLRLMDIQESGIWSTTKGFESSVL